MAEEESTAHVSRESKSARPGVPSCLFVSRCPCGDPCHSPARAHTPSRGTPSLHLVPSPPHAPFPGSLYYPVRSPSCHPDLGYGPASRIRWSAVTPHAEASRVGARSGDRPCPCRGLVRSQVCVRARGCGPACRSPVRGGRGPCGRLVVRRRTRRRPRNVVVLSWVEERGSEAFLSGSGLSSSSLVGVKVVRERSSERERKKI